MGSVLLTTMACDSGSSLPTAPSSGASFGGQVSGSTSKTSSGGTNASTSQGAGGFSSGLGASGSPSTTNAVPVPVVSSGKYPFPREPAISQFCARPVAASGQAVKDAYEAWKVATLSSEGASGFLRVRKPDSGTVIGSTVSEGMGYGLLLSVYFGEQEVFDQLWKYTELYLNDDGLMDWEVDPKGKIIGTGAATDGDEDIAFALVMAARQWGGQGTLSTPYLDLAKTMIEAILMHEVDNSRNSMLLPGDSWGSVDVTNISYFAPAYFRVFGAVTGKVDEWNAVIDENYAILFRSLNSENGNVENGLVPAWCNSSGEPVVAYSGAPTHFQNDSTRTPFRVGQDYCWFGEARAKTYLERIASFYASIGVDQIVDGYELDGTPKPERARDGLQAASFVGPAGVSFSASSAYADELERAWTAVATGELTAGTIYYQKSWAALSLLMMGGYFAILPEVAEEP